MSAIDLIIGRLQGSQAYGKGYRAHCPACGGKSRKLSVCEGDDGRALLHCFGGCDVLSVLQAVGLALTDLFPERLAEDTSDERRRRVRIARESQWGAALEVLKMESTVMLLAAEQLKEQKPFADEDTARLRLAHVRINDAQSVLRDAPRWRWKEKSA